MSALLKSITAGAVLAAGLSSPASAAWLLTGTGSVSGKTYYACKCKDGYYAMDWRTHAITQEQCTLKCGAHGIGTVMTKKQPLSRPVEK